MKKMSNNNNNINSSGVGFPALLTLLFIGLKLGNVITWSWVWVLSPIWISLSIFMILLVLAGILAILTK